MDARDNSGRTYSVQVFDGVNELVDAACGTPEAVANAMAWSPDHLNDSEFIGRKLRTHAAVHAACTGAWDDGVRIVEKMVDGLATADLPTPVCRNRRTCFRADDGQEVCIDRLRSGQDFWRDSRRTPASGPTVLTICVQIGGRASLAARDLQWRGAAALAAASVLESAGFRVELWAVNQSGQTYTDGVGSFTAVRLKGASDPLDVPTMAVACSGWFFRTALFFARCQSSRMQDCTAGFPQTPSDELCSRFVATDFELIADVFSEEAALAKARDLIERLGR